MNIHELVHFIESSEQHQFIYHFTDEANFGTIKEHGLLSKNRMKELGFWPTKPSGNQRSWDADDGKGISDFISVCLTRNHPMKFAAQNDERIEKPRYLCINPKVLLNDGVLFAPDIANKAGVNLSPLRESIPLIDVEVLYTRTDWTNPKIKARLDAAERCEILIPNSIALAEIPKVY